MRTLFLIAFLAAPFQEPPPKSAPPPAAGVEAMKKIVREAFKADYANRTAEGLRRLGERLRSEGLRVKEPVEQFAFLEEARDAALKAGAVDLALNTIDAISERYTVNGARMKADALEELKRKVKDPEEAKALARAYADLVEEAAAAKEFESALSLVVKAEAAARAAREEALATQMRDLGKELRELDTEYRDAAAARKKLDASPEDPAANLTLGLHQCFTEGDWKNGPACLAKGSDGALAKLGRSELASPAEPGAQEAMADEWWNAARQQKGRLQDGVRDRAFHWYEAARKQLAGVAKLQLERKLDRLAEETSGRSRLHPVLGYKLRAHPRTAQKFQTHWYQLFPETVPNRAEAQKRCQELGGYLVCIDSADEQAFVAKLADKHKVWIGGAIPEKGPWAWISGQPMTYTNWAPGQPNNGNSCFAQFWPGAGWHDITAAEQVPYPAGFICEWEF